MAYKVPNSSKTSPLDLPCKKTIYNSREEALYMILFLKEHRGGKELFPYKCDVCGFWHLTSKYKASV